MIWNKLVFYPAKINTKHDLGILLKFNNPCVRKILEKPREQPEKEVNNQGKNR